MFNTGGPPGPCSWAAGRCGLKGSLEGRGVGGPKGPDRPWGAGPTRRPRARRFAVSEALASGLRCVRFCIAVITFSCLL